MPVTGTVYVVIEFGNGLLDQVEVCNTREGALTLGQAIFRENTEEDLMHEEHQVSAEAMAEQEPGYDPHWGGVSRGHVMHWWNSGDELEVFVEECVPRK